MMLFFLLVFDMLLCACYRCVWVIDFHGTTKTVDFTLSMMQFFARSMFFCVLLGNELYMFMLKKNIDKDINNPQCAVPLDID